MAKRSLGRVVGSKWYTGYDFNEVEHPLEGDMFLNEREGVIYKYKNDGWVFSSSIGKDNVSGAYIFLDLSERLTIVNTMGDLFDTISNIGYQIYNEKFYIKIDNVYFSKLIFSTYDSKIYVNAIYTDDYYYAGECDLTETILSFYTNKCQKIATQKYVDDKVIVNMLDAEGIGAVKQKLNKATGAYAFATGYNTHAGQWNESMNTLTEGMNTAGNYAHTEGNANIAHGSASHAEGKKNLTWGEASHAEGYNNVTWGVASHVEGQSNIATGDKSHAEGYYTTAAHEGAHTEGRYTTSGRVYQTVVGEYNEVVSDALFVVGNGHRATVNTPEVRKNAFEVKEDGTALVNGKTVVTEDTLNSYGEMTKGYVDTQVANLVNSAPETLDTLKELSTALGNDPNFAATVATELGKKANKQDLNNYVSTNSLIQVLDELSEENPSQYYLSNEWAEQTYATKDEVPPKTDEGYTWYLDQADIRRLEFVDGGQIYFNWDVDDNDGTVIEYHAYGGEANVSSTMGFTYNGVPLFVNTHHNGGSVIALRDAWEDEPVYYSFPYDIYDDMGEKWCDLASTTYVDNAVANAELGKGITCDKAKYAERLSGWTIIGSSETNYDFLGSIIEINSSTGVPTGFVNKSHESEYLSNANNLISTATSEQVYIGKQSGLYIINVLEKYIVNNITTQYEHTILVSISDYQVDQVVEFSPQTGTQINENYIKYSGSTNKFRINTTSNTYDGTHTFQFKRVQCISKW